MRHATRLLLAFACCVSAAKVQPAQLTRLLKEAVSLPALVQLHAEHGERFNAIHVSAFWNRVKQIAGKRRSIEWRKLRQKPEAFVAVVEQTARMLPEMEARPVATIAQSYGKAGLFGAEPWQLVWDALPSAVVSKRKSFNSQELSNVMWAFATASVPAPGVFEALEESAVAKMKDFNPQELANTAWALATARHTAPALSEAIAAQVDIPTSYIPPLFIPPLFIPPHPTSPHLTPPHPTSPHLTSPQLTSPHLTSTDPRLLAHTAQPRLTSRAD